MNIANESTITEGSASSFSLQKDIKLQEDKNTALLGPTVYQKNGSFVKSGYYLFKELDKHNKPVKTVNVNEFKDTVGFFFASLLDIEYYVKSIPKESSLCFPELKTLSFKGFVLLWELKYTKCLDD